MPEKTRGADRTKVLSVRLTEEELEALSARATQIGVGPSTLARTFVRQALAGSATSTPASPAPHPGQSALEARLVALLEADLVPRVEALERRSDQP